MIVCDILPETQQIEILPNAQITDLQNCFISVDLEKPRRQRYGRHYMPEGVSITSLTGARLDISGGGEFNTPATLEIGDPFWIVEPYIDPQFPWLIQKGYGLIPRCDFGNEAVHRQARRKTLSYPCNAMDERGYLCFPIDEKLREQENGRYIATLAQGGRVLGIFCVDIAWHGAHIDAVSGAPVNERFPMDSGSSADDDDDCGCQ